MRYGIFSDIHANLEAFQAVLSALERQRVDQLFFLGDIVGYGADPVACLDLLKTAGADRPCLSVAGNHDAAVCGQNNMQYFVSYAKESVLWTRKVLSPEALSFLSQWPLTAESADFFAVHASVFQPDQWSYMNDIDDAYLSFQQMKKQICFIGHTHKPVVYSSGNTVSWFFQDRFKVEPATRYIVNVGSVGQPRDGDPRAAYVIYDSVTRGVEFCRVDYDIPLAQKKILNAGLPKILAERLQYGK